jgi:hypothetical protein
MYEKITFTILFSISCSFVGNNNTHDYQYIQYCLYKIGYTIYIHMIKRMQEDYAFVIEKYIIKRRECKTVAVFNSILT